MVYELIFVYINTEYKSFKRNIMIFLQEYAEYTF